MKRKIMDRLITWRKSEKGRMPMLLYGARQVGKTYIMQELGISQFQNTVYVNFESDQRVQGYFETDLNPVQIVQFLETYYNTKIIPDQTLIIFDEIQMCEKALTSLKYFCEQAPEYHVIAAGSLLGVALKRKNYSFPVGKVQMLTVYPMDFEEYLWAKKKELLAAKIRECYHFNLAMSETLHQEAIKEYYHYSILGGMPAAVLADITKEKVLQPAEINQMILNSYIADMAKYAQPSETVKIFAAYDSLPSQLAKESKKFQYKLIKAGARSSQYGQSIDWLIQSGIVNKCTKCTQGYMPPSAFLDLAAFKLYYSDLGILSARTNMTIKSLLSNESDRFRGIYTENYVACQLRANGYVLYYWESEGTAEVDFLIIKDDCLIPVECKAGSHVKAKSLHNYMEKYHPAYAIRISTRNFGMTENIKAVPLYAAFCI